MSNNTEEPTKEETQMFDQLTTNEAAAQATTLLFLKGQSIGYQKGYDTGYSVGKSNHSFTNCLIYAVGLTLGYFLMGYF